MPPSRLWLALVLTLTATALAADAPPSVAGAMKSRLAPHPRLLLPAGAEKALNDRAANDPRLGDLRSRVLTAADALQAAPPLTRTMVGRRLLGTSRLALYRIATQSLAYRLTGDATYATAARRDLLAVCGFADFNPAHFLDTAEMTAALAIGYDWLHDVLPDAEKAAVRRAILDKALHVDVSKEGWLKGDNNWTQVCHGGLALGALAIAEDIPDESTKVVQRAVAAVPRPMKHYSPDGCYPEGPMYWGYGTDYNCLLIAALESALGSDFGLGDAPGFLASADFHLQTVGPTGLLFNYADCPPKLNAPTAAAFYLARRRGEAALLYNDLRLLDARKPAAADKGVGYGAGQDWLMLIWSPDTLTLETPKALGYFGRGVTPIMVWRTSWDETAAFLGFKLGSAGASHAHMDVGSFVYDHGGVRWAADLGMQDYNSLETKGVKLWGMGQDAERWQVYRVGPTPHNIVTVNGRPPQVKGRADFLRIGDLTDDRHATADLTAVYAGQLASATRGVVLRPDGSVRVQDDLAAPADAPAVVRWAMLTPADATVDGSVATLTQKGKTVRLRVASPAGVTLKVEPADPPHDYDAANPGTRLVTFEVTLPAGESRTLAVDLLPEGTAGDAAIEPLATW